MRRLDAGQGERIPTLAEALDLAAERGGSVDLEIKNLPGEPAFDSPDESVLLATLEVVRESRFEGPLLVSSFNWVTIERCKELAPEVPTGFLTIGPIDAHAALVYVESARSRVRAAADARPDRGG